MGPMHRLWALAFDALAKGEHPWEHAPLRHSVASHFGIDPLTMMDTEDFDTWVDELEAEYERYRTVCEQNQHVPCSMELIFWTAREAEIQPTTLLRARQAQRRP